MPLVSMRQLLDHAAEHGYGVPAFNVNNMEQIKAIMQAARKTHSPVILQGSAGARKYAGEPSCATSSPLRSRPIPSSRSSCIRTTAPRPMSAWARSAPASRQ